MTTTMKALPETMRLSNLPTVLSGVFVVVAMSFRFESMILVDLIMLLVAISCFYVAGIIFNNIFRRGTVTDQRHIRPIPGRIKTHTAVQLGVLLILAGLILVAVVDQLFERMLPPVSRSGELSIPGGIPGGFFSAILLVICMLLYSRFNPSSAWAVLLFAAFRVLIYVTCLFVTLSQPEQYAVFFRTFFIGGVPVLGTGPFTWYLIAVFLYFAGVSRIARGEVTPDSEGGHYCYHCGHGIDTMGVDHCSNCGKALEQHKMTRSTRPPLNRVLERYSLAATFTPIGVLLLYILFQPHTRIAMMFGDELRLVLFAGVLVLVGYWLFMAVSQYRRDRTHPSKSVIMWVAGISLFDGLLAFEFGLPWWAPTICFGLFFVTILGQRRIAGT